MAPDRADNYRAAVGAAPMVTPKSPPPAPRRSFVSIVDNSAPPQIDQNRQNKVISARLRCRWGAFMTKVLALRSRAEQFRQLAAQFPNHEFREVISSLAATWENLADDRERLLPSRAADQHLAPTETVARISCAEPERDAEESRENKT